MPLKTRTLDFQILGRNLPGISFTESQGALVHREPVYLGIQRKNEVIDLVPGNARRAVFSFQVDVISNSTARLDFRGPFVHGKKGDRFLYLSWGDLRKDGSFSMFRRAKLRLSQIDGRDLQTVLSSHSTCMVRCRINLKGEDGGPICGSIVQKKSEWRFLRPRTK